MSVAVLAVGLLMLADQRGWRIPLPPLRLDRRWYWLFWVLLALVAALQVLRFAGAL